MEWNGAKLHQKDERGRNDHALGGEIRSLDPRRWTMQGLVRSDLDTLERVAIGDLFNQSFIGLNQARDRTES